MKRFLWLLLFFSPLAIALGGDEYVLAAREAYKNGERVKLDRQLEALHRLPQAHPLEPWVRYWQLRQRLEDDGVDNDSLRAQLGEFLTSHDNTYLAEKLRGEWLKTLGKRGRWEVFQRDYPLLVAPDQELACYALQARLALQQDATALEEARPQWFGSLQLPESCQPLMDGLVASGRIGEDDVWERLRRLLEARKLDQVVQVAQYLPARQAPNARTLASIADKPQRYLEQSHPGAQAGRLEREMALFAVQRLARQEPGGAALAWQKIQDAFAPGERGYAWGQIALAAAKSHLPEARSWYLLAGDAPLSEEQLAWQVRAALRAHDWSMVQQAIARMPLQMAAQADWIYWLGRALAAHGRSDEANALYHRIAEQPNFYGMLASEELNRAILPPPHATLLLREEVTSARDNPGLQRALAMIRLDMRVEGVREWNWTLRGMDDRQLLAAAAIAYSSEVFDRAISTADRTLVQHDYSLRYPAPFRELVEPRARGLALDNGWVYGLMRQESRFVFNAKSGVGAKGLMQLMPNTAKWVAKKMGLKGYRPAKVAEMDTNVALGTHYLAMVLASLDHHPLLASAAYNAGPGRARRWRAAEPLEGAIYAETIPFNETRDYVKKVMTNAVYYAAMFEDKPQSLKSRLGTISPRAAGKVDELP